MILFNIRYSFFVLLFKNSAYTLQSTPSVISERPLFPHPLFRCLFLFLLSEYVVMPLFFIQIFPLLVIFCSLSIPYDYRNWHCLFFFYYCVLNESLCFCALSSSHVRVYLCIFVIPHLIPFGISSDFVFFPNVISSYFNIISFFLLLIGLFY